MIVRPLSGLNDAADAWLAIIREFLTSAQYFLHTTAGACLVYDGADRPALVGVYVYNIVYTGKKELMKKSDAMAHKWPSKASQPLQFTFAG